MQFRQSASYLNHDQYQMPHEQTTCSSLPEFSVLELHDDDHRNYSVIHERKQEEAMQNLSSASEISFFDINYTKNEMSANLRCSDICSNYRKAKPKQYILHDVSGVFRTGMNAIMGKNLIDYGLENIV